MCHKTTHNKLMIDFYEALYFKMHGSYHGNGSHLGCNLFFLIDMFTSFKMLKICVVFVQQCL